MVGPKDRQRAGRACDICKKKKVRCSGVQPCETCARDQLDCTYYAPYFRGKVKSRRSRQGQQLPEFSSFSSGRESISQVRDVSTESPSQASQVGALLDRDGLAVPPPGTSAAANMVDLQLQGAVPDMESRPSPDSGESDSSGHFVGESSGLSFPLRLQRRLRQDMTAAAATSLFTLGDPLLPEFDLASFEWPSEEEAKKLLDIYFELASPTYRFLHRPTIESYLYQLYHLGGIYEPQSKCKAAILLVALAQATGYTETHSAAKDGLRFFQAAEKHLSDQTESVNLASIQALLGSCFYVLTCSRLNHCWTLFGTTARLILALGLHRRKTRTADRVEQQCAKRIYWSAYTLDKYLSAIFGRPSILQDDDTDQDFPAIVEDADLTSDAMSLTPENNMGLMLAPVSHHKLARILNSTLKQLYGIKTLDRATQYRVMNDLGARLNEWRSSLPAFLNPKKVDSRMLRPLFQRQSNLLSLASGHLEILIHRPCLFDDLSAQAQGENELAETYIQRCLDAAMSIVSIIDLMAETKQFYPVSWFAHYQAFSSVIVLYTFTIKSKYRGPSVWMKYYNAAQRCQGLIAAVPKPDSLGQRLLLIMEEYQREVVKQVMPDNSVPATDIDLSKTPASWVPGTTETWDLTELPNWEQLSSLALDTGFVDFEMNVTNSHLS